MTTNLRGGLVLHPAGPRRIDLTVADGLIAAIEIAGQPIDLDGATIAPGIIEAQLNGGWGHDFTADPGSIWEVGANLPRLGVTAFVPTIVTAPYSVATTAIEVLKAGPPDGYRGAIALGLHIEGPWISPDWHGAHDPGLLRPPDPAVAGDWASSGVVRMVTIAPELEGAWEVASLLSASGVVVSAGHSGADFETASRALAGPWSAVTHLYNQMSPFQHRGPGLVGAALTSTRVCGLIVDGLHSHPGAVGVAWRALGASRLMLITDAMAALGLGPGDYRLGELEVSVGEDGPRLGDGRLAGSILRPLDGIASLARWAGIRFGEAFRCATDTPARLLGLTERGSLEPGMRGDLTVLDEALEVVLTMVGGEIVYRREAGR